MPVIGWIGTHSTYPYLESIFPALQDLARSHRFLLKIIGSGRDRIRVPGVSVQTLDWSLEREVEDFQSFDIGLYPIIDDGWSAAKSGFKAIQYMAVGIPYVVTPLGASAEIGEPGVTHFCASSRDEWCEALSRLLRDGELRNEWERPAVNTPCGTITVSYAEMMSRVLFRALDNHKAVSRPVEPPPSA